MTTKIFLLVVFSLASAAPARAGQDSALQQLGADSGESVEAVQKGFERAAELAAESKALFAVIEKDGKRLLEIRADQIGAHYLFAATIDRGTGEKGMYSATMAGTFVWYFRLVDKDKVQFMRKNLAQRAEPGTPEAKAVEESYPDSLIATFPATSSGTTPGSLRIDARELFLTDFVSMSEDLKSVYNAPHKPMMLSNKDSSLGNIKVFPKNMEVDVHLQFAGADEAWSTLPDSRLIPISMHYSLSALPDSPGFQPRRADERVGFFQTSFQDLTNKDLKEKFKPTVHLINHWHLEKADPAAPVSDVKNPIVYWLDATVPNEYRPYIRSGILAWNAAFEAAGLRNALVVKEVDKDMPAEERSNFDPGNASYNVVRWFMGESTSMGVAPSRVNPMTGEIFNASIRLGDQLTRLTSFLTAVASGRQPSAAGHEHGPDCDHRQALQDSAAALALAEAQGPLTSEERARFMGELLTELTAHETGHTLGLRHNFQGGALNALDETGKDGLVSSSFMHYAPPNLAPKGREQGAYYQTQVGPYDRWAIEYGYKPLSQGDEAARRAELRGIAERSGSDARLKYCTDEDAGGTDPDCQRFMLGRDVVTFARQRATLADDLFKRLKNLEASGDEGNARLRESFAAGMSAYGGALRTVLPAIGGVRVRRVVPGDGPPPYEAVSAAEQRAALKFLDEKIFSAKPFDVPPSLLRRMAEDRLAGRYQPSAPFPLAESVLKLQKNALDHIYDQETLGRLSDSSLFGKSAVTPGEVMMTVRRSIWKEIESPRPSSIGLMRRNLQREHLTRLAGLLDSPDAAGDARAQARRDLDKIASNASRALAAGSLDDVSSSHLEDMRRLAGEALEGGKPRSDS